MKKEEIIAGLEVLCLYDDVLSCEYGQLSQKEVCTEAIKAIEQGGVLQEILDTKHIMTEGKTVKINNHSTVHDIVNGLNMAIGIVERHIKEYEE